MSNTSTSNGKTTGDDAKVKLIIGEIGRDTKTGIIGRGYSFDNGRTFHVTDTIFGRLYDDRDIDGVWNSGMHEKVKEKVNQEITNTVEPAIKQADSAVAYANDAIEKSRVNQQAIVDINSAVSEAVSDAAVARSDGLRAWNAAQSNVDLIDSNYASASAAISSARTEAIAAADEAKASASAAQADIVAVRSDVAAVQADVTATKSDVAVAKNDIVKAKSDATAGINAVKSDVAVAKSDITDTKTSLASQAKSLSSYAAQASAAGKDITTLKSQAGQLEQDMADTKGDVSQLKVSASSASVALSDAAGNISSLQATAKSYSAALSDTNSNVASVTATASELETKYADAAGDISQIKTDAKGTAETIADAQGDIASLKKRADGFDTQFTNAQSDIAVIQSDATGTKETLANTKSDVAVLQSRADGFDAKYSDVAGDISQIKADAKGMTQTISDAQGDIAKLKTRADGFDTEFASTNGNISKLQTDASGAKQTLTNAKSDIAVLQSRADGFDTKYANAAGDINTLKVDAKGFNQTLTSAKGDISTLQATATGFKNTLTDAQGNISTLQSDVAGLKKTTSDNAGNISTLQATAKTLTSQMGSAQGDISTLKQTASGFSSKVSGMATSLSDTSGKINDIKANGGGVNLVANTGTDIVIDATSPNASNWTWYTIHFTEQPKQGDSITVSADSTLTGTGTLDEYHVVLFDSAILQPRDAGQDLKAGKRDSVTLTLDNLNGTGDTVLLIYAGKPGETQGKKNVIHHLMVEKGIIAHDWSPAPEDTDAKITANTTAIDQNKKAIVLKADQKTVDKTNETVQYLQSQLKVQADQINAKVSSSDLPKLVGNGGKNMLLGTSDDWVTKTASGWMNVTTANDTKTSVADFHSGDKFTYSAVITNKSDTNVRLEMFCCDNNGTRMNGDSNHALSDAVAPNAIAQKVSCTITIDANTRFVEHTLIADGGTSTSKTVQIKDEMFETGIVAHDWAQAAADVQTYTQTQIKQTADSWNANLTSVHDGLVKSYTNLHATVDGIQAQVYNSDGTSKITQLSNLIATKVSQGDYNSQITQLKNDIDLRVTKGDVISQINQEAGGNTLIQVSNGKGSLILDAGNTVITGKAWIPVASIADLTADQIQAGTLTGSTVHLGDSNGNTIDLGVLGTNHVGLHSSAQNGDQTYIDYNGIKNSGTGYSTTISQGKIITGYMTVNGGGLIDFRSSGDGTTIDSQNIKFYNSNAVNGGIEFSGGNPIATVRDGTIGNELRVRYDRSFALTPITDESARICASSATMQVGFIQSGSSTPDLNTTGLLVDNDSRHVNLGVWGADSTWARMEASTHNIHMQAGEAHAWLSSDNVFRIYKDGDSSSTAIKLQVDGWAWVNGWVEAAGHGQHSALSTKTDIQSVDDDKMLKMVNDTDLATFLYKTDVANGETHRHIGLIIDDVHDVAQYQTPQDFIAPNGVSRDDDNMIGALFGAVKALTKRIKTLESKVG